MISARGIVLMPALAQSQPVDASKRRRDRAFRLGWWAMVVWLLFWALPIVDLIWGHPITGGEGSHSDVSQGIGMLGFLTVWLAIGAIGTFISSVLVVWGLYLNRRSIPVWVAAVIDTASWIGGSIMAWQVLH